MSSFFRQLGRGIVRWGRQIPGDVSRFGRMMSRGLIKASGGLGKASNFISALEKPLGGVPIVGQALKLAGVGLGGLRGITNAGAQGGQALNLLGQGNIKGAGNAAGDALKSLQSTGQAATQAVGLAAPLMAML